MVCGLLITTLFAGCGGHRLSRHQQETATRQLERDLTGLMTNASPKVQDEARELATIAIATIDQQDRRYRMLAMPWVNNGLVDIGLKQRGLCHHWAEDLVTALAAVQPQYYEVRWMVARKGKLREHNAVMIKVRDPASPARANQDLGIMKANGPALSVVSAGSGANGDRAQIQSVRVASFEAAQGPGIIIDPWRTAGRPFWVRADQDKYPWHDDTELLHDALP